MLRKFLAGLPLATLLLLGGCSTTSTSTTPRTAVEMALLTEVAERSIADLSYEQNLFYNRFYIDTAGFEPYEKHFVISSLRRRLLQLNMHSVEDPKDADVIVYPRTGVLAIDESRTLIGIPEIPLPIPSTDGTGGFVATPEIAFFRRHTQIARSRISAYAIDAKTRGMAFDLGSAIDERFYTRWVILALISFRTTDLGPPYRNRAME